MTDYDGLVRALIALGVMLIGFLFMRVYSRVLIKIRRTTFKELSLKKRPVTIIIEKLFFALVLVVALFILGFDSYEEFTFKFLVLLPNLMMVGLLFILGVLIIQLIMGVIGAIISYTKLEETVSEEISRNLMPIVLLSIKIVLYIVLIMTTVIFINIPGLQTLTTFILYPILILIFLVILVALVNPVRDFSASFYLKNIILNQSIMYNGFKANVKDITWFSTQIETENHKTVLIPNHVLAFSSIELVSPSKDIKSLEELKNKFVEQLPSFCGPASLQMALSIFNIESNQKELARLCGSIVRTNPDQVAGTHPQDLINVAQSFTQNNIKGSWISFDKIFNLKEEISTWLSEGALVIIDYKKKFLFPTAQKAHYSLVVGVRGNELLVVDPSSKSGGVYFADYRDVAIGMDTYSELIKGKRGYLVLAPKGTIAQNRINEGLIYYHPSMYKKISKSFEMKLNKLTSAPALIDMLPAFVKKRLKAEDQVSRVWRPK